MKVDALSRPVALVTGAGRNIGREIALGLSQAGVAVAINVRAAREEGRSVVDEIHAAGGAAMLCVADVRDREAVGRMVGEIEAQWGRLDILVNNAAVRREATLDTLSAEAWRETLEVVLDGAFHCTQAALPLLRRSDRGAVINIGGMTGHSGAPERAHVVTAKAGLVGLTRALAHDLAPYAITVNCVAPGMIERAHQTDSSTARPAHHARHAPLLGRRGTAHEVASAVVFLACGDARFITGQVLHVNGGAYLGA